MSNAWEKHFVRLLSAQSDVSWVNPTGVNPLIKKKKKKKKTLKKACVKEMVSFSFSLPIFLILLPPHHSSHASLSPLNLSPLPIGDVTHRTPPADRHQQCPPSKNRPAEHHPWHQIRGLFCQDPFFAADLVSGILKWDLC